LIGFFLKSFSLSELRSKFGERPAPVVVEEPVSPAVLPHETPSDLIEEEYTVGQNSSVYHTLLLAAKIPNEEIQKIIAAANTVAALNKISSGTKLSLFRNVNSSQVVKLAFKLSPLKTLVLNLNPALEWKPELESKEVLTKEFVFAGSITDNLWSSAVAAGIDPQTVYTFADIFSWQIDFDREIRPSDTWRILVERQFIDQNPYQWGNILVAEYRKGDEYFVAVRYTEEDGSAGYYDMNGVSVMGAFLKSPLRYSRISSRFQNRRFHPILKINRPHLGVDYAAPRNTPVRAVGEGRVEVAGRVGSNGIMVKIKHTGAYKTAYKHLMRLGKGVKKNASVEQGQIIGYVGSTGMATGAHLHFEFYEDDVYTDPLGKRFPREKSIAPKKLSQFKEAAENAIQRLNASYVNNIRTDAPSES
jgi:murein DD-endopeptidase MepM/ murein hydrolase activator NlpD